MLRHLNWRDGMLFCWSVCVCIALLAGQVCCAAADDSQNAPGNGDARIVRAGLVDQNVLAVTILEGNVELGTLTPYLKQAGDQWQVASAGQTNLLRDGLIVGVLTGNAETESRFFRPNDRYSGRRADRERLTDSRAWHVQLDSQVIKIRDVFRKSRVTNAAEIEGQRPEFCFEHTVYLKIESPLKKGTLTLSSDDPVIDDFQFEFDPLRTISEAIHVSLAGFRPSDPVKMATLSCWMGDGGPLDYRQASALPRFVVVDDQSGVAALRGEVKLGRDADQPCDHRGLGGRPDGTVSNYAGTPTFEIDFSKLQKSGRYRVLVQGLGSSLAFSIAEDVYRPVLDLALEGLAVHRWGEDRSVRLIDGSTWQRPAATPDRNQGSNAAPIFETRAVYTNANFADFEPGKIGLWKEGDPLASVVGGYMDAGDFDRNHEHWIVSYLLLDLAARKHAVEPELANALIEAALWNVDLWVRLQQADGAVPSAIEYAEHPRNGEPSWLNSQAMYVCGPGGKSNLNHAAQAAKAALTLRAIDAKKSQRYLDSAIQSLRWVDANGFLGQGDDEQQLDSLDGYALVCAELWAATGDPQWREKLEEFFRVRVPEAWSTLQPRAFSTVLTVLEIPPDTAKLDDRLRERLEGAVKATLQMTYFEGSSDRSAFGALKNGWVSLSWGNGGWPSNDCANVLRAWRLFDDPKCLDAAVRGFAYAAGGNPNNMPYLTGMHPRSVQHILHCDSRYSGLAAPAGIAIYGPSETDRGSAWPLNWHLSGEQTIYPEYEYWPPYENVHQYWKWGMQMEYTVHQSAITAIYFAGMLDGPR